MAEAIQTTSTIKHLSVGYGFRYKTVRLWIDKIKKNVKLKSRGRPPVSQAKESTIPVESCDLALELKRMGRKLYEPVKELSSDVKILIAEEYIRGNFPAKAINSLMGIGDRKVYEYVKLYKDKGPKCFAKSYFTAHRQALKL